MCILNWMGGVQFISIYSLRGFVLTCEGNEILEQDLSYLASTTCERAHSEVVRLRDTVSLCRVGE